MKTIKTITIVKTAAATIAAGSLLVIAPKAISATKEIAKYVKTFSKYKADYLNLEKEEFNNLLEKDATIKDGYVYISRDGLYHLLSEFNQMLTNKYLIIPEDEEFLEIKDFDETGIISASTYVDGIFNTPSHRVKINDNGEWVVKEKLFMRYMKCICNNLVAALNCSVNMK